MRSTLLPRENFMEENLENVDENMLQDFENRWRHFMTNWQRQRIYAVVQLVSIIVHLVHLLDIQAMLVNEIPRNLDSPDFAPAINSQVTSSSRHVPSRGSKLKASMMEMLVTQYEKLNTSIERLSNVLE